MVNVSAGFGINMDEGHEKAIYGNLKNIFSNKMNI